MKEIKEKYPEGTLNYEEEGPWSEEPDKWQFVDEETGLPCLLVRNALGAWCGYVGVSEGHRYFEQDYSLVDGDIIEVHGGLTYSNHCNCGYICHFVEEGEDDNIWWLGFDCCHYDDYVPGMTTMRAISPGFDDDRHYRTVDYAKNEVLKLAKQLKDKK